MVEAMDDLTLEIGDETDQIRIKGSPMKITKKSVKVFAIKEKHIKKY